MTENYSGTKCSSCQKSGFEVVKDTPRNCNFDLMYVRCMHCKTILAVTESRQNHILIKELARKMGYNLDHL